MKDSAVWLDGMPFATIQGEGIQTGYPTIFIRTFQCNFHSKCFNCDTLQLKENRIQASIGNIMHSVRMLRVTPFVTITGGEPMLQWESVYPLILELTGAHYQVSIETNGSYYIEPDSYLRSFRYVLDMKCPSTGKEGRNVYKSIMNLHAKDEIKFVLSDRNDYEFAKKVIARYPTPAKILFSPMFKNDKPMLGQDLCEWMIKDRLFHIRVGIQQHKILGVK